MSEEGNLFYQINRARDKANLTPTEEKHIPVISIPKTIKRGERFKIELKVGSIPHPQENEHHIQFVDLFVDDAYLIRVNFTPVVILSEATITAVLDRSGTLRAVSRCNIHGLWESSVELPIS